MMKRELDVQLNSEEPHGKFQENFMWDGRTHARTDGRTHGQTDHYRAPAIWRGPN